LATTLFIVSVPRSTVAWGLAVPIATSSNTSALGILTSSPYGGLWDDFNLPTGLSIAFPGVFSLESAVL
jgi:hypothetical protein